MPYPKLDELMTDLAKFVQHAEAQTKRLGPSNEKELLTVSLAKLKEWQATAGAELTAGFDWLFAVGEHQLAKATAVQANLAAVQADLAAAAAKMAQQAADAQAAKAGAAAAKAAASAPAPLDPGLGARLRDEVLGRFGKAAGAPDGPIGPGRDIWENWD